MGVGYMRPLPASCADALDTSFAKHGRFGDDFSVAANVRSIRSTLRISARSSPANLLALPASQTFKQSDIIAGIGEHANLGCVGLIADQ